MSKDTFYEAYFPMENGEHMEVRLAYSEGGINYFNYEQERRGLYLYFTPVKITGGDGNVTWTQRTLMDDRGRKLCVLEMQRRNKKKGEALAEIVRERAEAMAVLAVDQNWPAIAAMWEGVDA